MEDISDLIARLKAYNDWRTGKIDEYPVVASQITKDLKKVIEILSKLKDETTDF
jgi:hypothetical protein